MFMSGPGQTFVVAIFVDPIIEDTGWSRTTVSAVYSAGSICAFVEARSALRPSQGRETARTAAETEPTDWLTQARGAQL